MPAPVTFDDQIKDVLTRSLTELRTHLEGDLGRFSQELMRVAGEERARAVAQAVEAATADLKRQAEAQVARLQEAAQRQTDDIKRSAEGQVGEIRRALQAQLDEAQRTAQAQLDEARAAWQQQVEEARRTAQARAEEAERAAQARIDEVQRSSQAQADETRRAAREEAQEEIERVRQAAQAQAEAAQREAAEQVAGIQRALEAQLEAARASAQADLDEARRLAEAQLADARRSQQELEDARRLVVEQLDATRSEIEQVRRAGLSQTEQAIAQLDEARSEAERRLLDAIDRTRAEAHEADVTRTVRLLAGIRAVDEARTLIDVLDRVAELAGHEVDRAAVLVVKGDRLRTWRLVGFPAEQGGQAVEMTIDDSHLPGAVVRSGSIVARPAGGAGSDTAPALPSFADDESSAGRRAVAVPLVVGRRVVAVLYGDVAGSDEPASPQRWAELLEILGRHASRALEVLTLQRTTGLAAAPAVARASHEAASGRS